MALVTREDEARRLMPPPPPRKPGAETLAAPAPKPPVVLDEDTYTSHLEAIIERDYFPELPKMANQLEWLKAVNSGDVREIQKAQRNIAKRRAAAAAAAAAAGGGAGGLTPGLGLGPGETPVPGLPPFRTPGTVGWGGAATPGTGLLRTPAMTPLVGGDATPSAAALAAAAGHGPGDAAAAAAAAAGAAPGLSLDGFLSAYTSEDNASFQSILEEDNRRKRAKVAHHLERPDPRDPEVRAAILAGDPHRPTDGFGSTGQAPMTLLPAPEPPVNTLFYDSSQRPNVPLSVKEAAEMAIGPPKAINKAATRLKPGADAGPVMETVSPAAAAAAAVAAGLDPVAAAAAAVSAAAAAKGIPFGAPAPGPGGGTVGYNPMATPAFEDVLGTPLMTWGELGSTPLRLGADDMPVTLEAEGGGGPAFTVQGLTEREAAAHRLAAAKAASGSARSAAAGCKATPLLAALRRATGTGGGAGRGGAATPLAPSGGVPLSPAARQLAATIKNGGVTPRVGGATSAGGGGASGSAGGSGLRRHTPGHYGHGGNGGGARRRHGGGGGGSSVGGLDVGGVSAATVAAARQSALGAGELDGQLRASYRSAAAASTLRATPQGAGGTGGGGGASGLRVASAGHRTPVVAGSKGTGSKAAAGGKAAVAAAAPGPKAEAAAGAGASAGVTDDLLRL